MSSAGADDVEPVHLAAVDRVEARREPVRDVVRLDVRAPASADIRARADTRRAEHSRVPAGRSCRRLRAVRRRSSGSKRPVLLDDEDHVLDRVRRRDDHPMCPLPCLGHRRSACPADGPSRGALPPDGQNLPHEEEARSRARPPRRRGVGRSAGGLGVRGEAGRMMGPGRCCTRQESTRAAARHRGDRRAARRASPHARVSGIVRDGCAAPAGPTVRAPRRGRTARPVRPSVSMYGEVGRCGRPARAGTLVVARPLDQDAVGAGSRGSCRR